MSSQLTWTPPSLDHVDTIHNAIQGNVAEYFYNFRTREETQHWLTEAIQKHTEGTKQEYLLFDGGTFIGMVSPCFVSADTVEVGIWIVQSEQGKGYGTKAMRELFEQLRAQGVRQVIYDTDTKNIPSIHLATSLEFTPSEHDGGIRFTKML